MAITGSCKVHTALCIGTFFAKPQLEVEAKLKKYTYGPQGKLIRVTHGSASFPFPRGPPPFNYITSEAYLSLHLK